MKYLHQTDYGKTQVRKGMKRLIQQQRYTFNNHWKSDIAMFNTFICHAITMSYTLACAVHVMLNSHNWA